MGYRHRREDILAGAVEAATADGLSRLSFGRVAAHLGISDRTVVYYFPTKDDLLAAVLAALGDQLQATLGAAVSTPAPDHVAVVAAAWPILADPAADPTFALFFEATGLAAAGRDPYRRIVPELLAEWITWTATLIEGPATHRRTQAATAVAVIDGLLLLRQLAGPDTADRAARHLIASAR